MPWSHTNSGEVSLFTFYPELDPLHLRGVPQPQVCCNKWGVWIQTELFIMRPATSFTAETPFSYSKGSCYWLNLPLWARVYSIYGSPTPLQLPCVPLPVCLSVYLFLDQNPKLVSQFHPGDFPVLVARALCPQPTFPGSLSRCRVTCSSWFMGCGIPKIHKIGWENYFAFLLTSEVLNIGHKTKQWLTVLLVIWADIWLWLLDTCSVITPTLDLI